ncbi:50S ribosomal protein l4 [Plakobranchus ocellatus]|uniref:Large ribosomal subunit protein uL4m n=1 Tax=Plakobranchus ocellatus TaxID=259542 RepID=A0AAV4CNQ1_9GAST|nr:50S ribosomal protein l4 [Plakobranchus ocellatus]
MNCHPKLYTILCWPVGLKHIVNNFKRSKTVCKGWQTWACSQRLQSSISHDASKIKQESTDSTQETSSKPVVTSRSLKFPTKHTYPRLAWLESMDSVESKKLGILDLHPDVFAVYPRIDILHQNVHWQQMYRYIDYNFEKSRAELRGGGRKPWPQKGLGKARHGSIRSPLWIRGAKAHGPRGPTSYFYVLPRAVRGLGLRVALSCKYAQNDLVVVDSFDSLPSSDPEFMAEMADVRFWGYSVLFVDDTDVMPENIAVSSSGNDGFSLMPAYGLNVYSILKHETLVMTMAALEKVEKKLLEEMHSTDRQRKFVNTLRPEDFYTKSKEDNRMYRKWTQPLNF